MQLNNGLNPSIFSKFALGTNAGCPGGDLPLVLPGDVDFPY